MESKEYQLAPEPKTKASRKLSVFFPIIQYQVELVDPDEKTILKGEIQHLTFNASYNEKSEARKNLNDELFNAIADLIATHLEAVENLPEAEIVNEAENVTP